MEFKAVAKYVRISPQKLRRLFDAVKDKPVGTGINILKFMPQKGAAIIEKTLHSAVANAVARDSEMDVDNLVIRNIFADQGPSLKRFRARARGRGARILKRTSHLTVVLAADR